MIKLNKIEGTDIFEFSFQGDIDKQGIENFYELLEVKSKTHEKNKLLGIITEFPGFESFTAFTETLKMKVKAINNISKYAILSDKDWIEKLMPIGNFITPGMSIKHFDLSEKNKAIEWLGKN